MNRRWRSFVLWRIVLVGGCLGIFGIQEWRWLEHPDAETGVALVLEPARQVVPFRSHHVEVTLTVVNRGMREVVLVEPGDGSSSGRRTPRVEWSRRCLQRVPVCGHINDLKPDEVFTLKPGESRQLRSWAGAPNLLSHGRYRVAIRYTNIPDHDWLGIPFDGHDEAAMEAVQRSTPISVVSNSIEIVVE